MAAVRFPSSSRSLPFLHRIEVLLCSNLPSSRALHHVTQACGAAFSSELDSDLIDLVFNAIRHKNRFVRETGYYVCNEFVKIVQEETAPTLNLVSEIRFLR